MSLVTISIMIIVVVCNTNEPPISIIDERAECRVNKIGIKLSDTFLEQENDHEGFCKTVKNNDRYHTKYRWDKSDARKSTLAQGSDSSLLAIEYGYFLSAYDIRQVDPPLLHDELCLILLRQLNCPGPECNHGDTNDIGNTELTLKLIDSSDTSHGDGGFRHLERRDGFESEICQWMVIKVAIGLDGFEKAEIKGFSCSLCSRAAISFVIVAFVFTLLG